MERPARTAVVLALAAACASLAGAAHAQRTATDREVNEVAGTHFRLGMQHYRGGRPADAAREFQIVYDLVPQPEILYNIARAHEAAGNTAEAIAAYERFLARGAPSIGEEQVREIVTALRAHQPGASTAAPSAPPAGCPDPAPPSSASTPARPAGTPLLQLRVVRVEYRRSGLDEYGPFVVLGGGLVAGGFGAWQLLAAQRDIQLYNQANRGAITWGRDVQGAYGAAPGELVAGYVLSATGGALVLTGLGWVLFRGRGERRTITEAAAGPLPGGGFSVALGGRF